jgi:5-hydroxyisourate hydrolase-like protein (transthyretin family)
VLHALDRHDFVYGKAAEISISALDSQSSTPQAGVRITVLFKSTSEPRRLVLAEGETDDEGVFSASATLPEFSGGTSAVVITAESDLGQSEIKHLVHR